MVTIIVSTSSTTTIPPTYSPILPPIHFLSFSLSFLCPLPPLPPPPPAPAYRPRLQEWSHCISYIRERELRNKGYLYYVNTSCSGVVSTHYSAQFTILSRVRTPGSWRHTGKHWCSKPCQKFYLWEKIANISHGRWIWCVYKVHKSFWAHETYQTLPVPKADIGQAAVKSRHLHSSMLSSFHYALPKIRILKLWNFSKRVMF